MGRHGRRRVDDRLRASGFGLEILVAIVGGCASSPRATPPATPPAPEPEARSPKPEAPPAPLAKQVVADFQQAVLTSSAAYTALFDFAAVGEYEILLHRYDLNGRFPQLPAEVRAQFAAEDGTPYPAARERHNVGAFYPILAQRTVGTGGCTAAPPATHYAQNLGVPFEPLPAGTPPGYEVLRAHANAWLAAGGVIALRCTGGEGGLAVVYTRADNARGYQLITIYDD